MCSTEPVLAKRLDACTLQVAAAIEAKGAKALYVKADLTVVAEAENVITQAEKTFGRIDGLVNCAAVATRGEWGEVTEAHIDRHAHPWPAQCQRFKRSVWHGWSVVAPSGADCINSTSVRLSC